MDLFDLITYYLNNETFEGMRESEDYQAAKDQKNAAERELVATMTKKQRRMFHEYIQQREAMTSVALVHLLEKCTLVVSGAPKPR